MRPGVAVFYSGGDAVATDNFDPGVAFLPPAEPPPSYALHDVGNRGTKQGLNM